MELYKLEEKSIQYREDIIKLITKAGAGHTGGSLSCVDILNVIYNEIMDVSRESISSPDRDRYIHSKGHSVEALYVVLADKGFISKEELDTFYKYGSKLIGHPTRKVNGIEQNTGSLGHGLPLAAGIALSAKRDGKFYRVYTLLGDGELTEGSNWEASIFAAHYQLDNLTVIVDRNHLQITDFTDKVMDTEPLTDKFQAFGYSVREVDGHDLDALINTFRSVPFEAGKPSLVIARTVKGKGISFIENNIGWHHHVPNKEEFILALEELDATRKKLQERYGLIKAS